MSNSIQFLFLTSLRPYYRRLAKIVKQTKKEHRGRKCMFIMVCGKLYMLNIARNQVYLIVDTTGQKTIKEKR